MIWQHTPVHNRAEEENEINIRRDNSELLEALGSSFWGLVWKRIESSAPRREPGVQVPETTLQAPRDYVVETESQIHTRPS